MAVQRTFQTQISRKIEAIRSVTDYPNWPRNRVWSNRILARPAARTNLKSGSVQSHVGLLLEYSNVVSIPPVLVGIQRYAHHVCCGWPRSSPVGFRSGNVSHHYSRYILLHLHVALNHPRPFHLRLSSLAATHTPTATSPDAIHAHTHSLSLPVETVVRVTHTPAGACRSHTLSVAASRDGCLRWPLSTSTGAQSARPEGAGLRDRQPPEVVPWERPDQGAGEGSRPGSTCAGE